VTAAQVPKCAAAENVVPREHAAFFAPRQSFAARTISDVTALKEDFKTSIAENENAKQTFLVLS